MPEGRVHSIFTRKDDQVPVLLNFQNGNIRSSETNKLECSLFEDVKTNKDVVLAASSQLLYKGEIPSPDDNLVNTLIAIRNKKTGKVRLIEVDMCNLTACTNDYKKPSELNEDTKTHKERNIQLNKVFGSKRAKRKIDINEKLSVSSAVVKDQLEQTVQEMDIKPADIVISDVDSLSDCFPPIHREAKTVDEVYLLHELLPQEDLNILEVEAKKILQEDIADMDFCDYIKEYMEQLKESDDISSCAVLIYVDAIIKTMTADYKDIRKKTLNVCPYSTAVNKHILEKFTLNTGFIRTRPQMVKDKAASYAIILLLLSLGHVLEFERLCRVLKVKEKLMQDIAKSLGLSVDKVDKTTVLVLRIPLAKPNVRQATRKKQLK